MAFRTAGYLPFLILMPGAATLTGCAPQLNRNQGNRFTEPTRFDSAEITLWVRRGEGPARPLTRHLDQRSANELAAFFPGVGTNMRSNWAGGWMDRVGIVFHRNNGSVEVNVSSDFQYWTEGNAHGDFQICGDLRDYIDRLFNVPNECASN